MNKKVHVIFIWLFIVFNGFSQNISEYSPMLVLNDYYRMNIRNIVKQKDNLLVCCGVGNNENKLLSAAVYTIKSNKEITKLNISLDKGVNLSDILINNDKILVSGALFLKLDGEETKDYLALYDFNKKKIWSLALEMKFEGLFKVFWKSDYIEAFSEGTKGLVYYKISLEGKVFEKKTISIKAYHEDILQSSNSEFILLSELLDSKGNPISILLTVLGSDLKPVKTSKIKSIKSFMPISLLETSNSYAIVGNISEVPGFVNEPDSNCAYVIYLNKNMELKSSTYYNVAPDSHSFANTVQLKSVIYDNDTKSFIGVGIKQTITKPTNIVFRFNESKIISFKSFETTSTWANSIILKNGSNGYVIGMDYKQKEDDDEFATKVKIRYVN